MRTSRTIRNLLRAMPVGYIFTTRQLIGIGSRASIDQCLSRLVHKGILQRLANGVFFYGTDPPTITPMELAQIKAGAFEKTVYEHPQTTARRLAYAPNTDENDAHARDKRDHMQARVFATNGTGATSFRSIFGRIYLKAVSARKYRAERNEVWEVLRSIWQLGVEGFTSKIRTQITKCWGRQSQDSLERYCSSIPHWLLDEFPRDFGKALKNVGQNFQRQAEEHTRRMTAGCWCPADPHCICPMFNCAYCQTQPIRNRFTLVFG